MGLGEDYVKKLEEQRKLRERILKTKEQRRKQVKPSEDQKAISSSASTSSLQKSCVENEADSTVALAKGSGGGGSSSAAGGVSGVGGKTKKVLRIVKDKSGKIISKKVWWYNFFININKLLLDYHFNFKCQIKSLLL